MNTEAFLLSLIICFIGLALAFVFFNPWGFVLDGIGFLVFLYAINSKKEEQYHTHSSGTPHQNKDDWTSLAENAMNAIREDTDYIHFEKVKTLVFNYQKARAKKNLWKPLKPLNNTVLTVQFSE